MANHLKAQKARNVSHLLTEGSSVWSTARLTASQIGTIVKHPNVAGEPMPRVHGSVHTWPSGWTAKLRMPQHNFCRRQSSARVMLAMTARLRNGLLSLDDSMRGGAA